MTHHRRRGVLATLSLGLVLAACGSEGAGEAADPSGDRGGTERATVAPGDAVASSTAAVAGCTPPPPLPGDVPTLSAQQAPQSPSADRLTAVIETTCGPVTVELLGAEAPQTVASFELLADVGYWEGSPCHRLTTQGIWVLQCGDPTGTGRGAPGYTFGIENAPEDGQYPRGTVAMARSVDPDSNGGQFFVVHRDTQLPVEGGGYSIFGRVTDGMDIIDRIAAQGVDGGGADGRPAQPVSILQVDVTEE